MLFTCLFLVLVTFEVVHCELVKNNAGEYTITGDPIPVLGGKFGIIFIFFLQNVIHFKLLVVLFQNPIGLNDTPILKYLN